MKKKPLRAVFVGFGNVGQRLAAMLTQKSDANSPAWPIWSWKLWLRTGKEKKNVRENSA
ncbi:MAG: hypothetical protein KJ808_01925 [Acidobacteria bacterium]|nr:hypothetical protein [Acidobacteriota bacterium]MBU4404806.1 hypothetical protein [Acidobacteriota bacterium]MCG2812051.1 hypothetical protein [Candidatus Aminicenantes bacterium]